MEGVYLRWTLENWITVLLMAAAGYLVFAVAAQLFINRGSLSGAPNLRVVSGR